MVKVVIQDLNEIVVILQHLDKDYVNSQDSILRVFKSQPGDNNLMQVVYQRKS